MAQTNAEKFIALSMVPELAVQVSTAIASGASTNTAVAALVALTDSSGGTPSNTIVDVPATYTEATLANQLASLTAKVNQIIAALKT